LIQKNIIGLFSASFLAAMVILQTGCGDDTNETTATPSDEISGVFLDSAVAGLSYTCSSGKTGITNASGQYSCKKEDNVSFALGSYVLGSCKASTTITPDDLSTNSMIVANVAQLLQTLDTDNDLSLIHI